jgi:hypothetical protein
MMNMNLLDVLGSKYNLLVHCANATPEPVFENAESLRHLLGYIKKNQEIVDLDRLLDDLLYRMFKPDDTELLIEIASEQPTDTGWRIERLCAATVLLMLQMNPNYAVEYRDFAIAAIVEDGTSAGAPYDLASARFLLWLSQQYVPERSRSQVVLAGACILSAVLASELEACIILLREEISSNAMSPISIGPPPLLNYSADITATWSEVVSVGSAATDRARTSISAFAHLTGLPLK